jgi:hypothetical protein
MVRLITSERVLQEGREAKITSGGPPTLLPLDLCALWAFFRLSVRLDKKACAVDLVLKPANSIPQRIRPQSRPLVRGDVIRVV